MAADSLVARRRAMPTAAGRGGPRSRRRTSTPTGTSEQRRSARASWPRTRSRATPATCAPHVAAGDFLLGVAEPAAGGLRWPDWADPDGRRSETHFTSFDDGAAGISDFLWTLYEATREPRFRAGALAGMRWLVARAEGRSCPAIACSWSWTDDPSWSVAYYGVGMGQAGIVLALDAFADRTGDPTFRNYARAGAARLRTSDGERHAPAAARIGRAQTHETGFLSGSAGAAYMFLERYRRDRDPADLATARRLLALGERSGHGGLRGRLSAGRSPTTRRLERVRLRARRRGNRLGQPAGRPRDRRRRRTATSRAGAGAWLRHVGTAGGAWAELPGERPPTCTSVSTAVRRGSAGCSRTSPARASTGLRTGRPRARRSPGLRAEARRDRLGAFWYANRTGARPRLRAEPSWHWGSAGIAAFAARLAGWSGPGSRRAARSLTADQPDKIGARHERGRRTLVGALRAAARASRADHDRGPRARPAPLARGPRRRRQRSSSTAGRSEWAC